MPDEDKDFNEFSIKGAMKLAKASSESSFGLDDARPRIIPKAAFRRGTNRQTGSDSRRQATRSKTNKNSPGPLK